MADTRLIRVPLERRWYDGPTIVWKLIGGLSAVLAVFAGVAWQIMESGRNTNAVQDVKIQKVETTVDGIDKRQERMELKQDRMSDKIDEILRFVK